MSSIEFKVELVKSFFEMFKVNTGWCGWIEDGDF